MGVLVRMMPWAVPGRLTTTSALVMMRHPRPIVEGHRLAVSRNGIRDVGQGQGQADRFWSELAAWADDAGLIGPDDLLVTNFGDRQDVRLLHVHVLPQRPAWAQGDPDVSAAGLPATVTALRKRWSESWKGRSGSVGFTRRSEGWCAYVDLAH